MPGHIYLQISIWWGIAEYLQNAHELFNLPQEIRCYTTNNNWINFFCGKPSAGECTHCGLILAEHDAISSIASVQRSPLSLFSPSSYKTCNAMLALAMITD